MGFTPLDGVMMGTRPGSLDPGILLYLLKNKTYSLKELEYILNHESGILGISGLSENMREIIKKKSKNSRAKLAFEMFISSIAKKIASLMTTLEGCEHLVFTGGIGENSPEVRQNIVKKLSYLGLKLDSKKNKTPALNSKISTSISKISVWVFAASEEKSIAQQCDILSN